MFLTDEKLLKRDTRSHHLRDADTALSRDVTGRYYHILPTQHFSGTLKTYKKVREPNFVVKIPSKSHELILMI